MFASYRVYILGPINNFLHLEVIKVFNLGNTLFMGKVLILLYGLSVSVFRDPYMSLLSSNELLTN